MICAATQPDGSISVINIATGVCLRSIRDPSSALINPQLSPDGTRLFAIEIVDMWSSKWWIWNIENGALLRNGLGNDRCVFSPDSSRAVLIHSRWSNTDEDTELIDAKSGKKLANPGILNREGGCGVFTQK